MASASSVGYNDVSRMVSARLSRHDEPHSSLKEVVVVVRNALRTAVWAFRYYYLRTYNTQKCGMAHLHLPSNWLRSIWSLKVIFIVGKIFHFPIFVLLLRNFLECWVHIKASVSLSFGFDEKAINSRTWQASLLKMLYSDRNSQSCKLAG